jgi:transposase-like protein
VVTAQSAGQPHCLRCKTAALVAVPSPDSISFYECPNCHRAFARKADGALCFRWRHPISLVLYPVIFEVNPTERCERIADMFAKQESTEQINAIVQEIKLELADPTQQVRDILDCHASEEDLRKYLRCVAAHLDKFA